MSTGAVYTGKNFPTPAIIDGRVCLILSVPDALEYRAAIMGQLEWLADWRCWRHSNIDYADPPQVNRDIAAMFAEMVATAVWEECPMNCDEMLACLAPLFDDLNTQITTLQGQVTALQETNNANSANDRPIGQSAVENEICGAATAVVLAMHQRNVDLYEATEASPVDSVFEQIPVIMRAIPFFGELPFDEMFQLVDWHFEHQVEVYNSAFDGVKDALICDLKCFVQANGNQFTWDVWSEWLVYEGTVRSTNAAAGLFARYAPARQTFLNQIAALINHNASLQAYFDELSVAWTGGLKTPVECTDCECPDEYCQVFTADNGLATFFTPTGFLGNQAVWSGTGWGYNPAVSVGRITLQATFAATTNINRMVVTFDVPTTSGNIQQVVVFSPTFATSIGNAPSSTATVDINTTDGDYDNVLIDVEADSNAGIDPIPGEIISIEFHGVGLWHSVGGEPC